MSFFHGAQVMETQRAQCPTAAGRQVVPSATYEAAQSEAAAKAQKPAMVGAVIRP